MLYRMRNSVVEMVQFIVVVTAMWLVIWATITYVIDSAQPAVTWICQHPRVVAILVAVAILDRLYVGSRERYLSETRMRRNRARLAEQLRRHPA